MLTLYIIIKMLWIEENVFVLDIVPVDKIIMARWYFFWNNSQDCLWHNSCLPKYSCYCFCSITSLGLWGLVRKSHIDKQAYHTCVDTTSKNSCWSLTIIYYWVPLLSSSKIIVFDTDKSILLTSKGKLILAINMFPILGEFIKRYYDHQPAYTLIWANITWL